MYSVALNNLFDFVNYITNRFTSFPVKILKGKYPFHCHVRGNPNRYFRYHYSGKTVDLTSIKGKFHPKCRIKCGNFCNNPSLTTSYMCLDFDDHKGEFDIATFNSVLDKLSSYGLKPIIMPTSTGEGRHLYVLFDRPLATVNLAAILKTHFTLPSVDRFPKGSSQFGGNLWYPCHYNLQKPKRDYILDYFGSITSLPLSDPRKFLILTADNPITEQSEFKLCKHPDISPKLYLRLKTITNEIDLRWIFGDALINFSPDATKSMKCRDVRSPTGDRDPSMLVTVDKDNRGGVLCFRDDTIYAPIHYLFHFRGFTVESGTRYLHKFWHLPYNRKTFYE